MQRAIMSIINEKCYKTHLFLLGCIGLRLALVFGAYKLLSSPSSGTNESYRKMFSIFTLIIGISFILLWTCGLRQTARESTAPNNKVWWNDLRPIHGILWVIFGIMLYNNVKYAWIVLLFDTLFGLERWIQYRFCG
jgi:hypothetical protein